jgi:ankyrin repeat protein
MSRHPHLLTVLLLPLAATVACAEDIHQLLRDGDLYKARALLKDDRLLEARDDLEQTPLHLAAHRGHTAIVKLLLERGAKVNARAYNQFTPLHLAEAPEIVKLLLGYRADLEARSVFGHTPLEDAASHCGDDEGSADDSPYRKKVRLLLDAGASYDARSATYLGDVDRVRALLARQPGLAPEEGLLRIAVRYGRADIVRLLLEHKADPQEPGWFARPVLYSAVEHPEVVRLLLRAGADPTGPPEKDDKPFGPLDPDRQTPLHWAAERGPVESARLLLAAGVSVNVRTAGNETPLHRAVAAARPEMVKFLLDNHANIDGEDGRRAMATAAFHVRPPAADDLSAGRRSSGEEKDEQDITSRDKEVIAVLHARGVPLDLFAAVAVGKTERVKELLKEKPALARARDREGRAGRSALYRAISLGHKEIAVLLLDAGAPATEKDELGCTLLHWAAFWGRDEIARLLIDHKADVRARAVDGFTPLHEAARLGTSAVARVLLAAGADVNATDNKGRTPLSWAERPETVRVLREHGGRK